MAKMRLTNVHPDLDGEYPLDLETGYNKWELHCIKKLTGLAGMDLFEAIEKDDPDIIVGLTMVVLMRAGKITSSTPWTSPQVKLIWTQGEISEVEEAEEIGPPEVTLDLSETTSESEQKPNGSSDDSGINGNTPSEIPEPFPSPTGALS